MTAEPDPVLTDAELERLYAYRQLQAPPQKPGVFRNLAELVVNIVFCSLLFAGGFYLGKAFWSLGKLLWRAW